MQHLGVGAGGVGKCRAQAGEQRIAPPVGNPLGGVLERVGHGVASSRWVLIRVRNWAARDQYRMRWSQARVIVIEWPGTTAPALHHGQFPDLSGRKRRRLRRHDQRRRTSDP